MARANDATETMMRRLFALSFFAVLIALICHDSMAQPPLAGRVEFIEGDVRFIDAFQQTRRPVKGDELRAGDTIVTGRDGEVHLDMDDGGYLAARPNTRLKVVDYRADGGKNDRSILDLIAGTFRSITGWIPRVAPKGYRVTMTTATLGIRGTDHEPLIIPEGSALGEAGAYDKVNEGSTILEGPGGSIEIPPDTAGFMPAKPDTRARLLSKIPDFFLQTAHENLFDGRHKAVQDKLQERLDTRRRRLDQNQAPDASSNGESPDASPKADPSGSSIAPPAADAAGKDIPKVPLPAAAGAAGATGLAVPRPSVGAGLPPLPAAPGVPDLSSVSLIRMPNLGGITELPAIPATTRASGAPETAPAPRADPSRAATAPAARAAKPPGAGTSSPVVSRRPTARAADDDRAARLQRERDARLSDHRGEYEKDRESLRERGSDKPRQ